MCGLCYDADCHCLASNEVYKMPAISKDVKCPTCQQKVGTVGDAAVKWYGEATAILEKHFTKKPECRP
jgi:hypothetical protein